MHPGVYRVFADIALITHVTFVLFAVLGLVLILCGGVLGWRWTRNPLFRIMHLAGIGLVVLQVWLGINCPLTTLEMHLREKAGDSTYGGTFVAHWLHKLLFYQAPPWVFVVCYTLFGLAVVVSWIKFRPRPSGSDAEEAQSGFAQP
ncbi:MAG: DUF2784 domain-containing protein [Lentisphaerae bacterium]|jgi:hypothetical protein|nr:DUF2784 domain-containing protein [Lentisphaerota bacterium]MBT4822999.1 DUF2784 domain-containing protein [Lentisphaerota bacterium]MBT5612326.1 DUF2784 domain-containing protein [Lentisphaerota bacterium]MBT7056630.1 DUF2784 domain-containing protein [Lentisphaerota bacterium]MBT7840555.1 DUF2784 domain-containing protein [Lentisphaerota bacterium]